MDGALFPKGVEELDCLVLVFQIHPIEGSENGPGLSLSLVLDISLTKLRVLPSHFLSHFY